MGLFVLGLAPLGCVADHDSPTPKKSAPPPEAKKAAVGKNVFLEVQGDRRRVLVQTYVCLRQGQLEQFLTRKRTKEHEAILAADVDARHIHAALTLAGAEAGKPVQFAPKYRPASGTPVKVFVEYTDKKNNKVIRNTAQDWILNVKTKKPLKHDWVFGGSVLIPDPLDKTRPPFYAANDGDIICISNFETAMLDLPINSSQDNDDLLFQANTERIPPLDTPVVVILEPVSKSREKKNR